MKISVAMCTYNGSQYLREQLESLLIQTRPPDELVVCDDRSTDDSRKIVEEFGRKAPFPVRLYLNEINLGSTKNFAKAINLCEGDAVALSDQDDVWHADKLRRAEELLSADAEVGFVFSDGELVDEHLRPLGQNLWQSIKFRKPEQKLFKNGKAFDVLLIQNIVTGATLVFRMKFKPLILPIPIEFNQEDFIFLHDGWIALLLSAVSRAAFIPDSLFKYRQHIHQQIGARGNEAQSAPERIDESLSKVVGAAKRKNSYVAQISLLNAVRQRMREQLHQFDLGEALATVEDRLAHLVARSNMPNSKASRLPVVLKEVVTLRYFRYSNGVYSAAKDLLS